MNKQNLLNKILLGIKFELTGQLGIRTKYQVDKTAQLIARAVYNNDDQQTLDEELNTLPNVEQILKQIGGDNAPQNRQLDDDSILYETPQLDQYDDENKKIKLDQLNVHEQILLLGMIENIQRTVANDEVLQEQIEAYLNLMLCKSNNWLVYSRGLLLRSLNEFSRFKKMERSLAQLQNLVDQINDIQPNGACRYAFYYSLHYPDLYTLNKILGQYWMKAGGMQSGYQIFFNLEMWDECIECLIAQGDLQKAQSQIKAFQSMGAATLKMQCILAEITGDYVQLKRIWKESNKKFARVQRSLGEYYFFKAKDYNKSIKCYERALKINSYHCNSWFVLGCAYMRTNQLDQAIKSFSQCVGVEETNYEAWANLSSCLQQKGELINAMSMLEQAVKFNEGNWRIWFNLMQLSLKNKKFYRFYSCIERLIKLKHIEILDVSTLKKINQTMQYQLQLYNKECRRQVRFIKERIERLYLFLTQELGSLPIIWDNYADFGELCVIYEQIKYQDESSEQESDKQDQSNQEEKKVKFKEQSEYFNDISKVLIEIYIYIKKHILKQYHKNIQNLKIKIANLRLNSCQMAMKIGWESDVSQCNLIHQLLIKLVQVANYFDSKEDSINLTLLIKQLTPKLEKALDIKIQF